MPDVPQGRGARPTLPGGAPGRMPGSAERGPRFLRPPRPRAHRPLRGRCFLLLCPCGAGNSLPGAAAREQCTASCRAAGPRPRSRSPPWAAGKWAGARPAAPVHRVAPRETAGAGRGLGADPGLQAEAEVTQGWPGGSGCPSHLHAHIAHCVSACVRACNTLDRSHIPCAQPPGCAMCLSPSSILHRPPWRGTEGTDIHLSTPQNCGWASPRAMPGAVHWGFSSEQNQEKPLAAEAYLLVREKAKTIIN